MVGGVCQGMYGQSPQINCFSSMMASQRDGDCIVMLGVSLSIPILDTPL